MTLITFAPIIFLFIGFVCLFSLWLVTDIELQNAKIEILLLKRKITEQKTNNDG